MALTSKEKLFNSLASNGWDLDPRAKKQTDRYNRALIQNPNVVVKDAAHGGQWRIHLNWAYSGVGFNRGEGNRLKSVHVDYAPTDVEYEVTEGGYDGTSYVTIGDLENTDNVGWKHSFIWDALKWTGKDETVGTFRQAVELLVTDPDTALWLSMEHQYQEQVKEAERARKQLEEQNARRRPLPITVSQKSVNYAPSEWKQLTRKVSEASVRLDKADGTSDLPQLVANLQIALNGIVEVLDDDAKGDLRDLLTIMSDNL